MFVSRSKLRCWKARLRRPWGFPPSALLTCTSVIAYLCVASASPASSRIPVQVDPLTGDDSRCVTTFVCASIAYAIHVLGASHVNLGSGIFNESTVNIKNVVSLVIAGMPLHTVFDCSRRLQSSGAAFNISNSTVTFTGITFQHCFNENGNGGALSAVESSVTVSQCGFFNCSAANGGAVSAAGRNRGFSLDVQNCSFIRNSAIGGLIGCPAGLLSIEPCSTWGGAVAAFEMSNVSVTGCTMVENSVLAIVPAESQQNGASQNAVAGGGCVSVLFRGNSSTSTVIISGNSFQQCTVNVSSLSNIRVGNGIFCCFASICAVSYCCSLTTNCRIRWRIVGELWFISRAAAAQRFFLQHCTAEQRVHQL
jgi:hypothetical protein